MYKEKYETHHYFTQTQMPSGKVLITGGLSETKRDAEWKAQLFDTKTRKVEVMPFNLHYLRAKHSAVLTADG